MPKSRRTSAAPIEREIKFLLDARTARRLRLDPAVSGIEPAVFDQVSEYWDTEQRDLRAAGLSLRLRRFADRTVQTIKAESDPGTGVVGRVEDEIAVEGDTPKVDLLERHAPAELMQAIAGRLQPQFLISVKRTQWRVDVSGSRFNIDLDEGRIEAAAKRQPLRELEVELVEGSVQGLFALSRELALRLPLTMAFCTKSDRGFGLLDGGDCRLRKPFVRPLDPDLTRADAFRILAMATIRSFAIHAGSFTRESPADAIHGMRVAIRRLRSLLRFDRDLFTKDEGDRLHEEINWVFDRLGAARNLDIVLAEMGAWPADALPDGALDSLKRERAAAYDQVAKTLRSARHRIGVVDLVTMVECGRWTERGVGSPARDAPAHKGARRAFRRAWKAIFEADPPSELSIERRHRLRIQAKRLRYASEFYAGLYPGAKAAERCGRMVETATSLQDALGLLNDRAMIDALIEARYPGISRPEHAAGAPADDAALLRAADKAHRRLTAIKPFWE